MCSGGGFLLKSEGCSRQKVKPQTVTYWTITSNKVKLHMMSRVVSSHLLRHVCLFCLQEAVETTSQYYHVVIISIINGLWWQVSVLTSLHLFLELVFMVHKISQSHFHRHSIRGILIQHYSQWGSDVLFLSPPPRRWVFLVVRRIMHLGG